MECTRQSFECLFCQGSHLRASQLRISIWMELRCHLDRFTIGLRADGHNVSWSARGSQAFPRRSTSSDRGVGPWNPFPRSSFFVRRSSPFGKQRLCARHRIYPFRRRARSMVLPCAFEARPRQAHAAGSSPALPPCIRMVSNVKGRGPNQRVPFEPEVVSVEKGMLHWKNRPTTRTKGTKRPHWLVQAFVELHKSRFTYACVFENGCNARKTM